MSITEADRDESIIRIGIDLGTTNSEIAYCNKDNVEILKNAQGMDYTPSVFGISKSGNKIVGKAAYDKIWSGSKEDIENSKREIKRLMGTNEVVHFSRANKDFTPEEISSEIIVNLKENISRKYPNAKQVAAIITIPAHFESLQCEATKRAGELAGFSYVELVQEPIAAAISYGFNNDDANILAYDLGGGTFDVALISSRDGILKVVGHGGDNYLGGKDIDRLLVENVIKKEILKKYKLASFDENNEEYKTVFGKLRLIAENAKISLSTEQSVTIEIDNIGEDDNGKEIYLDFSYSRKEFNELIEPIIEKTIEIANNVISQSTLRKEDIAKIVFIGGPTQIPYLRERVGESLGIEPDYSADPLTAVARGACIYGLGRRIPEEAMMLSHVKEAEDEVTLTLNYESVTAEEDEMITGIADLPDGNGEYYIKIDSSNSDFYHSPRIPVRNGKFYDSVPIEPDKTNDFTITLFDGRGRSIPVFPNFFSITHGLVVSGIPIPRGIGVIYSKKSFESDFAFVEECDPFFEKGNILPLEATRSYKTVKTLRKDSDNPLQIKVYEGDSKNPKDNEVITELKIDGSQLEHNLPKGTEVELTIKVDESRNVSVEAFIPDADLTIESEFVRIDTHSKSIDVEELSNEIEVQKRRVAAVKMENQEKQKIIEEIEEVEELAEEDDADNRQKASRDIKRIRQKLDQVEEDSTMPILEGEFKSLKKDVAELIEKVSKDIEEVAPKYLEMFNIICKDGDDAIKENDKIKLIQANNYLRGMQIRILQESPYFWVMMLKRLLEDRETLFEGEALEESLYYFDRANRALERNDIEELKECVRKLLSLVPRDEQNALMDGMSGITK